jgi:hypothetical protein
MKHKNTGIDSALSVAFVFQNYTHINPVCEILVIAHECYFTILLLRQVNAE